MVGGSGPIPAATAVDASTLGELVEGRLVVLTGTLIARPVRATSGDLAFRVADAESREVRVMADASSRIDAARFNAGVRYRFVGIAGQRATRKGRLDGYRIWLRDAGDVTVAGAPVTGDGAPSGGWNSFGRSFEVSAGRRSDRRHFDRPRHPGPG